MKHNADTQPYHIFCLQIQGI